MSEELTESDVLFMGTDGLWDVTSNEKAAEVVQRSLDHFPANDAQRYKCSGSLKAKRCMSMPSVVPSSTNGVGFRNGTAPSSSSFGGSKSRMLRLQDRRFHHKFPSVCAEEPLLNYFSCALQDLLLLQGHLFITNNYFAFYSNIFGHKKEILIPLLEVVKVTKEKTAKFIPNAVGVYTEHEKFVFGSLLSRDTAFRVIQQTWIRSTDAGLGLHEDSESEVSPLLVLMRPGEEDSSASSAVSGQLTSDDVSLGMTSDASPLGTTPEGTSSTGVTSSVATIPHRNAFSNYVAEPLRETLLSRHSLRRVKKCLNKVEGAILSSKLPRSSLLFMISTALIVFLLMSTTVLFYRISLVHQRFPEAHNFYNSMARYNHVTSMIDRDIEAEKLIIKVQERIKHLTMIRHALEELLVTATTYGKSKGLPVE